MKMRRWSGGVVEWWSVALLASSLGAAEPHLIDLPTALQLAGAQNLDVKIAREKLAEAKANHESAWLQFFPWLSPGAGYRKHEGRIQDVAGSVFDASKQSYTAGGALTAQVDIGDALYKTLAAKQLIHAADHALDAQRQETILAAAQGYFDLAKAQAAVGVAQEAVRISQDYENQIGRAVEAGISLKGDELRVRVQTERNQLTVRQAQEQQRIAAARLAQTLRLDPKVELVARDSDLAPLALTKSDATLDALVGQAYASRPELRQSHALTQAARETKDGAVYGPMIPSVGAQAFAGGLGGGTGGSTGSFRDSEDYFVGLSWRIGPGGLGDFGRIHAADARLKQSQLVGEKLRDEITRQVVEAHTRVQSQGDQVATAKKALSTAEESLRLARQRKQFGVAYVLENIQAEQELTRTRNDYLGAVAEFNKAQYALGRAVGSPVVASGK
ncbi:MAG: TolC family protein [Verrucomicrobia bacterium]|nr:TolC family protein [Verrucomicrobiota bacterium]